MSEHKYKVIYDMEAKPEGLTKDQVPEGKSATDALLVASILYPEDGSLSVFFRGLDGRDGGKELDDHEWFKVWMMLTKRLGDSKTLPKNKRELCATLFRDVIVPGMRG